MAFILFLLLIFSHSQSLGNDLSSDVENLMELLYPKDDLPLDEPNTLSVLSAPVLRSGQREQYMFARIWKENGEKDLSKFSSEFYLGQRASRQGASEWYFYRSKLWVLLNKMGCDQLNEELVVVTGKMYHVTLHFNDEPAPVQARAYVVIAEENPYEPRYQTGDQATWLAPFLYLPKNGVLQSCQVEIENYKDPKYLNPIHTN